MKLQLKNLKSICVGAGLLISVSGCVPAPDHERTKMLPANDVKITMNKSGQAEVSEVAAADTPDTEASNTEAPDTEAAEPQPPEASR